MTPARVYVRLPNWVGDVVMATPVLKACRSAWPGAHLVAALRAHLVPLLSGSDLVDDLWPVTRADERQFLRRSPLARRLAAFDADLAIILTHSFGSAWVPWRAGVRRRVGYAANGRGLLLSAPRLAFHRRVPVPMPVLYTRLLDELGLAGGDLRYRLPVLPADVLAAAALLQACGVDLNRPLVGLNPGAAFGASKLWAPENFALVGDALAAQGRQVVVLCGPGEEPLAAAIVRAMKQPVASLVGRVPPLDHLRGVIARLALLVTGDTGPRHIAVALGVPTVALLGPTDAGWTAIHEERARVISHPVTCGPCHLPVCTTDHRCMTLITPAEVTAAAEHLLAGAV